LTYLYNVQSMFVIYLSRCLLL